MFLHESFHIEIFKDADFKNDNNLFKFQLKNIQLRHICKNQSLLGDTFCELNLT